MFADEVADLKDAYPNRMRLVHVLSREAQEVDLFTGRLDAAKLRTLLPALVDVPAVSDWWLCGPFGMVAGAMEVLSGFGVPRQRMHRELFYVEEEPPPEVTCAPMPFRNTPLSLPPLSLAAPVPLTVTVPGPPAMIVLAVSISTP